jgi:hypothetical protein
LHDQLIDQKKRHSGLEVIQQLLQGRLLELAADRRGNETLFGQRPLQIDLRREDAGANARHGAGQTLQQRRAGNRHRRAFDERRAGHD